MKLMLNILWVIYVFQISVLGQAMAQHEALTQQPSNPIDFLLNKLNNQVQANLMDAFKQSRLTYNPRLKSSLSETQVKKTLLNELGPYLTTGFRPQANRLYRTYQTSLQSNPSQKSQLEGKFEKQMIQAWVNYCKVQVPKWLSSHSKLQDSLLARTRGLLQKRGDKLANDLKCAGVILLSVVIAISLGLIAFKLHSQGVLGQNMQEEVSEQDLNTKKQEFDSEVERAVADITGEELQNSVTGKSSSEQVENAKPNPESNPAKQKTPRVKTPTFKNIHFKS
jgi:hypothetical protein